MRKLCRWSVTLGIAFALLGGAATTVGADPIVFSARAPFQASIGSHITDDYSAPGYLDGDVQARPSVIVHSDAHMTSVVGETRYMTTGHPNTNVIIDDVNDPKYCAGCNGSFRLLFDETSIGTDRGVFAAGFDFVNSDISGSPANPFLYDAFVEFGDGTSRSFDLPASGIGLMFFGITSEARIRSIHFAPFGGGTPSRNGYFAIDNLTLGSSPAPVPEPASMLLVATGLLGAGVRRWRQRNA